MPPHLQVPTSCSPPFANSAAKPGECKLNGRVSLANCDATRASRCPSEALLRWTLPAPRCCTATSPSGGRTELPGPKAASPPGGFAAVSMPRAAMPPTVEPSCSPPFANSDAKPGECKLGGRVSLANCDATRVSRCPPEALVRWTLPAAASRAVVLHMGAPSAPQLLGPRPVSPLIAAKSIHLRLSNLHPRPCPVEHRCLRARRCSVCVALRC